MTWLVTWFPPDFLDLCYLADFTWTKFVSTAYPCTIYTLKMNIRWGYRIFGKYSVFFQKPNIRFSEYTNTGHKKVKIRTRKERKTFRTNKYVQYNLGMREKVEFPTIFILKIYFWYEPVLWSIEMPVGMNLGYISCPI